MIVCPHQGRACGCGQSGCVESYASAKNTADIMNERLTVLEGANNYKVIKGSKNVFDSAQDGNTIAIDVIDEAADYLAIMCLNICRIVDPEVIIFGGGMALAGNVLFDKVRQKVNERTWSVLATDVVITTAQQVEHAGMYGAALVAKRSLPPLVETKKTAPSLSDEVVDVNDTEKKTLLKTFFVTILAPITMQTILQAFGFYV